PFGQGHGYLLAPLRQPSIPPHLLLAHLSPRLPSANPSLLPHRLLLHPYALHQSAHELRTLPKARPACTRGSPTDHALAHSSALSRARAALDSPTVNQT